MITFRVLHFPDHCPPWQADYSNSGTFVLLSRAAPIESFAQSQVLIKKKRNEFGRKLIWVILGKIHRHKEASPWKGYLSLFVMPSQLSKKNECLQQYWIICGLIPAETSLSSFEIEVASDVSLNKNLKIILLSRWSAIFPTEFSLLQVFIRHNVMHSDNLFPADLYKAWDD